MRAQTVEVTECSGRILSSPIFRSGEKTLLAKGHILRDEDIRILRMEGMETIWVTALDEDENPKKPPFAVSRAKWLAAATKFSSCVRRPGESHRYRVAVWRSRTAAPMNCTSGVVIATTLNFAFAAAGRRIPTIKSAPFAVAESDFEGSMTRCCGSAVPFFRRAPQKAVRLLSCIATQPMETGQDSV